MVEISSGRSMLPLGLVTRPRVLLYDVSSTVLLGIERFASYVTPSTLSLVTERTPDARHPGPRAGISLRNPAVSAPGHRLPLRT